MVLLEGSATCWLPCYELKPHVNSVAISMFRVPVILEKHLVSNNQKTQQCNCRCVRYRAVCSIPYAACQVKKKKKMTFQLFILNVKCVWTSHLWSHEVGHFLSTFRWDLLERCKTQIALAGMIRDFFLHFAFCFSQMGLKFCLALNHGAQALGAWRMTRCHLLFIIVEAYFLQACIGDIHPGAEESSLKVSSHYIA